MNTLRKWLDHTIECFCCGLTAIMVVIACWQVISRYVFNSPSTFSEEFLRFALVWLSVIGLAYVAGRREHIALTLFIDKCPARLRLYWNALVQVIFILFSIYILILGGWKVSANAMLQISPVLHVSMGRVYYVLPLAGVITIVYSVMNIIDMFQQDKATKHTQTHSKHHPHLAGDNYD